MSQIASTAVIKDNVKIGDNVVIKDFVVIYPGVTIEDNVEIMEGAIIGRIPKGARATARKTIEDFKTVIIGEGTVISPHVVIYTDVKIGSGTLIGDGASIREGCVVGDNCIISRCVTVNYNTKIGNKTKIMDNTHITGNMTIGDNVFISVLVSTTNDNNIGANGYDEKFVKGPTIKDNVLIGASASILPNTIIGENSIIASGTVVTKNIEKKISCHGHSWESGEKVTLRAKNITLRELKIKDAEDMHEFITDKEISKSLIFMRYPYSSENMINFVENSWNDKINIHYAISNSADEYIGTVSLKNIEYVDRTAEYAIVIRKKFWGQKIAYEATNKILFYGFNILNLNKIYLNVLANNNRAISFYEKYGFEKEGFFKKHIFHYGEYIDLIWYALFRENFNES